jgi:uncharacterized membrane protein YbhN (UPF0104 family)
MSAAAWRDDGGLVTVLAAAPSRIASRLAAGVSPGTPARSAASIRLAARVPGRISTRTVSVAAGAAVTVAVVAVAATQLDLAELGASLRATDPRWVAVASVVAVGAFAGNALCLLAVTARRVPLLRAIGAQVAGSALRLVSPASVGTYALNTQLLRRAGAGTQEAAASVAAGEIVQFLATVPLVAAVVAVAAPDLSVDLPGGATMLAAAGLGAALAAVLLHGRARRWLAGWVRSTAETMRALVAQPRRAGLAILGATAVTVAYAGALTASVAAAHGHLSLRDAVLVHLAGSLLGSAVPTPGGAVGVEAVLAGALVTVGLPLATAVVAVVVFRAVTFWLPLPVGLAVLGRLRAAGAV